MENIPSGFIKPPEKKSNPDLALVSVSAIQAPKFDTSAILSTNLVRTVPELNSSQFTEDGLFITPKQPLNRKVMKPYPSTLKDPIKEGKSHRKHFTGKLLEVAIRDILVHSEQDCEQSSLQISSASVLFKEKSICQESYPFNRKLHKFLIRNPPDFVHFSVQIFGQDGSSVKVPIPFPKHEVRNKKLEIDFGITDGSGQAFSGLLVCTVSVKVREEEPKVEIVHHPPSEDPNNPQRIFSIPRWRNEVENQAKNYFLLEDPALVLKSQERQLTVSRAKKDLPKTPEIVVLEPTFSLMSFAFIRNCFLDQTQLPKIPTIPTGQQPKGKQMLTVTILRGIEVPVREESALVQPVVEVEWCNIVHSTAVADGPAPVWQQTLQFKVSRISGEQHIKLRLFDQHPIWGPQWLGETLIPLESLNINLNQEVERWIGLNPLRSPTHLFGYIQASPGYSYTRLYVLMKMHQMGVAGRVDEGSLEGLSKSIQKCLSVPYKIDQLEDPQEIAKLVTLLSPVPAQYGPVKPKQALDLNKVDPFGRAALLTTLFHGLGLQAYVLLGDNNFFPSHKKECKERNAFMVGVHFSGSSQTSKLTSYCLTTDPNLNTYLWDPDSGNYYDLNDSRCSLTTVFRLIDPKTVCIFLDSKGRTLNFVLHILWFPYFVSDMGQYSKILSTFNSKIQSGFQQRLAGSKLQFSNGKSICTNPTAAQRKSDEPTRQH